MHFRIPWFFNIFAIAAGLQMNTVLGSIYPTQPISRTKFSAGQLALITWRDDWRVPHLEDAGHMRIDLHGNNSDYLFTLARHVAPITRSHSIFIPPGLQSASHYTLRFITTDPPLTIRTANFTITTESYLFPARPIIANTTALPNSSHTFNPAAASTVQTTTGAHPDNAFGSGSNPAKKSRSASTKIDSETIRFWLFANLWPTLIGISMAF